LFVECLTHSARVWFHFSTPKFTPVVDGGLVVLVFLSVFSLSDEAIAAYFTGGEAAIRETEPAGLFVATVDEDGPLLAVAFRDARDDVVLAGELVSFLEVILLRLRGADARELVWL